MNAVAVGLLWKFVGRFSELDSTASCGVNAEVCVRGIGSRALQSCVIVE